MRGREWDAAHPVLYNAERSLRAPLGGVGEARMRESFRKRQRTGALQYALRLRGGKTVSRETRETAGGTPALHAADGGEKGGGEERVCRCVFLLVERGWGKTCGTPDFRGLGRVFCRSKMGR